MGTIQLNDIQLSELIGTLSARFAKHKKRHEGIEWANVVSKIRNNPTKAASLYAMEQSGGEPDVVGVDDATGGFIFFDCADESPKGRRSYCYDREALDSRKEHKPANNVLDAAREMGARLLDETQYRFLQTLGKFDLKTSSWVKTPDAIRKLGGAVFCDRRYDTVFLYHNGAESYYAARGFRCALIV